MTAQEHILNKTLELFYHRGCKSVTMDNIAQYNGISKRTLYEIFPSKAKLIVAALEQNQLISEEIVDKLSKNTSNFIEQIFVLHTINMKELFSLNDLFVEDVERYYPDIFRNYIITLNKQKIDYIEQRIQDGIEKDIFIKYINPKYMAFLLRDTFKIVKDSKELASILSPQEGSLGIAIITILRGISTNKGREIIDQHINRLVKNKTFVRKNNNQQYEKIYYSFNVISSTDTIKILFPK
ncbi:MAG: TetR/AcrR family transcriptional regulator [Bacteroidales bacterium]